MVQISESNRKIAKNTLFLYVRMLLVMFVTLYTSRLILKVLGVNDFGIYNVVGGVVSVLGIIQSVMTSAVSRFFMFELGRGNYDRLNKLFRLSIIVYVGIAIAIILVAETIGLWFINNKIIIPSDRIIAANWVYQFAVFSFVAKMMSVPYNSIIIAHEKMNVFAYIGIAEVILKLLIVFLLMYINIDKLKIYSILNFLVVFAISSSYYFYSRLKYQESKFNWYWNKAMFKEIISFSIWSLFGSVASVARNHGINVLLGMFFNPTINAARAIAFQVNTAVNQFSSNFFTAVRPQIMKQFAAEEHEGMMSLIFRSSRFSFYLVLILIVPILLETPFIINQWLIDPPEYTVLFTRLVLITSIIDSMSYPFMTAINATGNIKKYQMVTGSLLILTLPIAYFFLKLGYPPEVTMYVAIGVSVVAQISRIIFMKIQQNMSIGLYFKQVILLVVGVLILSFVFPFFVYQSLTSSFIRFILVVIVSILSSLSSIYIVGISKSEKKIINAIVKSNIKKLFNEKNS